MPFSLHYYPASSAPTQTYVSNPLYLPRAMNVVQPANAPIRNAQYAPQITSIPTHPGTSTTYSSNTKKQSYRPYHRYESGSIPPQSTYRQSSQSQQKHVTTARKQTEAQPLSYSEQLRCALKTLRIFLYSKKLFSWKFEEDWITCAPFWEFLYRLDIADSDKVYFLQYTLCGDALFFDETTVNNGTGTWHSILDQFTKRFKSKYKQE